jgi:hypothetical protein
LVTGRLVGAARPLQFKNTPTGICDDIKIDVSYAKGHTKQVIAASGASPNFTMFGGTGRLTPIRASASVSPPTVCTCRCSPVVMVGSI